MSNATYFITGAGQGLGRELALALARRGATIILHGRKPEKLERVYDEIVESGAPEPFIMPLDFTQASVESFSEIGSALARDVPALDGMIHCAADLGSVAPLAHQTPEYLRSTWLVNVMGPVLLTRACELSLRKAQSPCIIFTTDSHVAQPAAYWGGYGVSKAAIAHFASMLAAEWDFARVHAIAPGAIDSPLRNKTHPGETRAQRRPLNLVVNDYLALLTPSADLPR